MSDLLKINVNEHTEKKNGLTYLSWAWAWAEVLKIDAAANWRPMSFNATGQPVSILCSMPDGTAFVGVDVTIKGITRNCMLPVMDHRNKAIPNPNAFDVNKALMRCLAKAISMHGLGLYIYAGEDMPESEDQPKREEKPDRSDELAELANFMAESHEKGNDMVAIRAWYDAKSWSADVPTANEEKKYVWGLLKDYSKLRSTIKANSPEELAKSAIKEAA